MKSFTRHLRNPVILVVFWGLFSAIIGPTAFGAEKTLVVPDKYPTIQEAIDAASSGDTVLIKAGIYEELLTFKDGINLQGEDRDKVKVRCNAKSGSVVTVNKCRKGNITELTFEHSSVNPDDMVGEKRLKIPLIIMSESSISIVRCTISGGVNNGILIQGAGECKILDSEISDNGWNGIAVTGSGANPVIKGNQCSNNREHGIYFGEGAEGLAKQNICTNNKCHGIIVVGKGTSPILKRNRCSTNGGNGIYFDSGTVGLAEENICTGNDYNGISVMGKGTNPTLTGNDCSSNKKNGIWIGKQARSIAENNTCQNNKLHGISVNDKDTSPTLKRNRCSVNGESGIIFFSGTGGLAEQNVCTKNKWHGISVFDQSTKPTLRRNQCIENERTGIWFPDSTKAKSIENICRNNGSIEFHQLRNLLKAEKFDDLEEIASRLREKKLRFKRGAWQLHDFYEFLGRPWVGLRPLKEKGLFGVLDRWIAARPESITPHIIKARAYVSIARHVYGCDCTLKMTTEDRKVFVEKLRAASGVLEAAEKLTVKDPELNWLHLTVGTGLRKPDAEMDKLLSKGAAIEPGYYPLYTQRAISLLPPWGGRPGQLEALAERAVEWTKKTEGQSLYAIIAGVVLQKEGPSKFLINHRFSYPRIKQGHLDFLTNYPESTFFLNRYCLFASLYKDKKTAKRLFDKIGNAWDKEVWNDERYFKKYRRWASAGDTGSTQATSKPAASTSKNSDRDKAGNK